MFIVYKKRPEEKSKKDTIKVNKDLPKISHLKTETQTNELQNMKSLVESISSVSSQNFVNKLSNPKPNMNVTVSSVDLEEYKDILPDVDSQKTFSNANLLSPVKKYSTKKNLY